MTKMKKAYEAYRNLGSNTRLIIRITLIIFVSLSAVIMYASSETGATNHFRLFLLTDELLQCTKTVLATGTLGAVLVGVTEQKSS